MRDTPGRRLDRRSVLRTLGAGVAGTATGGIAAGSVAADPSDEHYHNPVGPFGMGDPTVLQWDDGTYYAYGTHRHFARSTDLVNWEDRSPVVDWEPDWHGDPEAGFWAPDVNDYDGQVYLYYSHSTWGSQDNPGIGVATADHPEGPFTDHGPVFRDEDLSMTNCIDPDLVVEDGTPYLIWGSFFGIWGVELTPDGMDFVSGTEFQLAGDNREGPMIVRENGYYYLFLSTGHCCDGADSTYEIEVGRAESLTGPYSNRDGVDLRDVDEHHAGQAVVSPTDQWIGTGHNTAIQDAVGDWWMLYHVEATAAREGRIMMLDRIQFDDEDWPVVGCDGTPCAEAPRPTIGDVDPCADAEPTPLDPWLRVGDGDDWNEWQNASEVTVEAGQSVELGPRATEGGSWSWSGPGLSAETREVVVTPEDDAAYTATFSNDCDSTSTAEFSVTVASSGRCADAAGEPAEVGGQTVCDVDGDGNYRDVTGDGSVTNSDVTEFFANQHAPPWDERVDLFDFDGDDAVGQSDVVALFEHVTSA